MEEKPNVIELGIEFVIELLLFLYPYGAEQMGLPHNFWLGLGCWIVGAAIAVRMFWIFPLWTKRLTRLEKALIAFIGIAIFVLIFFRPVVNAYRAQQEGASKPDKQPQQLASSETPPPTVILAPPAPKPIKHHKPQATKPTVSTSGNDSPAVGSITQGQGSALSLNQKGGVTAGTYNGTSEPTERALTQEQADVIVQKLSAIPAPFWMMTGSDIHGHEGKIRESIDEQGAFEIQLENLLIRANWEDFLVTGCKDVRGLLAAKHDAGIDGKDGNAPLEQYVSTHNGAIDVSLFNSPAGCGWPSYEAPFHGILIESPLEFMDAAKALNDGLSKLMIRSRVRRADVLSNNGGRLPCIFVHVGTT